MAEKKLISFLSLVFSLFFVSYSFAAEVHFQWGTSSGVVDGYRIYYGSSHEGPYPNLLDQVGGTTTEYLASLNEGQEYYLVARAYNDYGESGNSNEIKWPSDYQDQPPEISAFTAEPSNPIILGEQVIFRAQATDPDGYPLTYTISFGDGAAEESGNEVVHTYAAVGTYAATLTVTDSSNAVDTATMQIIVAESSEAIYINFQPENAPVPESYLPDSGGYFDETIGYGWTAAPASYGAKDRNNSLSPDQAHDTMIHVAPSAAWEMAVPNGTYTVTVCVGDPSFPNNIQSVQVEGISVIDQEPLDSSQRWIEREEVVDVTDGRLTLTFDGCDITRLCYVKVNGDLNGGELVNQLPEAVIEASAISGEAPFAVTFDASGSSDSDGYIVQYEWTINGGQTVAGQVVEHIFIDPGEYLVTLTVTDDEGGSSDAQVTISVSEFAPEEVTVAVNFQAANAPVPEGFLPDSGGYFDETIGYGWTAAPASYGAKDRNNSLSPDQAHDTMIHVAPSAAWEMAVPNGTYTVTVCVGDPSFPNNIQSVQVEGISVIDQEPLDSSQRWIEREEVVDVTDGRLTLTFDGCDITRLCYVKVNGDLNGGELVNQLPEAVIEASAISGEAPFAVTFDASGSSDSDGYIVQYEWTINGGQTVAGQVVEHIFIDPGEYLVTLTVTDDEGGSSDAQVTISVSEFAPEEVTVAVNFQAANAPVPEGFLPDSGGYFDETIGYGWTAAPASYGAKDRNNSLSPDQAHDTMIHVAPSAAWEMAVPNGTYTVTVCVGDPSFPNNIQSVQVEGISVIDQEPLDSSQRWIEREEVVDVTDGRLTLTFDGCDITRLCYVKVNGDLNGGELVNQLPEAVIEASAISGEAPFAVTFDAGGSSDSDGYIVQYEWTINGGQTVAGQVVEHIFIDPGEYLVTLTVTDDEGGSSDVRLIISVSEFAPEEVIVAVNFQAANAPVPEGFLPDSGGYFDETAGYGWISGPSSCGARDRNSSLSPDQAHDTMIHVAPSAAWEMAVPNGTYTVTVCVGDPKFPKNIQSVQVEGISVIDQEPLDRSQRWIEREEVVDVTDGRLTLTFDGCDITRLCYVLCEGGW